MTTPALTALRELHDRLAAELTPRHMDLYLNGDLPGELPARRDGRPRPYVILWAGLGTPGDRAAVAPDFDPADGRTIPIRLMCVGPTPGAALHAAETAHKAVMLATLTRGCLIESEEDPGPPVKDTAVTTAVWVIPRSYTLHT